MNAHGKPDAQNLQETANKPVATSFRFYPPDFRAMDILRIGAGPVGEDLSRAELLRHILRDYWKRTRSGAYPHGHNTTGKRKTPKKGKRK